MCLAGFLLPSLSVTLNAGAFADERLQSGVLADAQPPRAGARLFASVGSISDGTHLLDGQLGGFEMRVFYSQNQELARDSQGNLLDRDGNITGDASQALAIPAPSATVWTKGE